MQVDLLRLGRDVGGRDVGVDARVDADRPRGGRRWPESSATASCEQLDVELEADGRDVPGLLGAEQLARAADLEVAHRDREAGAELGVVGERREPGAGLGRQLLRVGIEEVRVRGDVGAADAPADLVELGEPERVRALDDERVRLRDVEARLDDRRRDEHVGVAAQEAQASAARARAPRIWPCATRKRSSGHELLELRRRLVDRLDAVVQVERLAAARVLALERRADRAPRRTRRRTCGSAGGPRAASR